MKRNRTHRFLPFFGLCVAALATTTTSGKADVYITQGADTTNSILSEYSDDGTHLQDFGLGILNQPHGVRVGPDNRIYVANTEAAEVDVLDPSTGDFSTFIAAGSGGLTEPVEISFHDNGTGMKVYVSDFHTGGSQGQGAGGVFRYDLSGNFIDEFILPGTSTADGALNNAYGLGWDPNTGNCLVGNLNANTVVPGQPNSINVYNGTTGSFVGYLTVDSTGNLDGANTITPRGIAFGPNGNLFVADEGNTGSGGTVPSGVSEWFLPGQMPDFDTWFVPQGSNGTRGLQDLTYTSLGLLAVDPAGGQVVAFDPNSGAFFGAFAVGMNQPRAAAQGPPAFPQYTNQNSIRTFFHSAIMTGDTKQGKPNPVKFWDTRFAKDVNAAIGNNYNEISFAFMECFGGGMIDELLDLNLDPASYTSAAAENETAWARSEDLSSGIDPLFAQIRRVESVYNLRYAPAAGGAAPGTQRAAAMAGWNNDILSPPNLAATRRTWSINFTGETPQYTSSGPIGDGITLHHNNPNKNIQSTRYLAILFGGSTPLDAGPALANNGQQLPPKMGQQATYQQGNLGVNWNTLNRIHDALTAAGYRDNTEIFAMYPSTKDPKGNPVPAWLRDINAKGKPPRLTTAKELEAAWRWVGQNTNATTQIFFWSSWGHGTREFDWAGWRKSQQQKIIRKQAFAVPMPPELTNQMATVFNYYNPNGSDGSPMGPDLEITTSIPVVGWQIAIDNIPLPFLSENANPFGDRSEWRYKFRIPLAVMDAFEASTTHWLTVDYTCNPDNVASDFIVQLGPTLGDYANGPSLAPPQ